MTNDALLSVIRIVGSGMKVAAELGVTRQRVNAWLNNAIEMPLQYAFICQHLVEGRITWDQLSPKAAASIPKKWRNQLFPLPIATTSHDSSFLTRWNHAKDTNS